MAIKYKNALADADLEPKATATKSVNPTKTGGGSSVPDPTTQKTSPIQNYLANNNATSGTATSTPTTSVNKYSTALADATQNNVETPTQSQNVTPNTSQVNVGNNNSASSVTPYQQALATSTNDTDLDEYYKNLQNQTYKTLLQSNIQAGVAKSQAEKYTRNQLNASGYGSQGIAESTGLGISNSYRNALAENNATYNEKMDSIYSEMLNARKEGQTELYDSIATDISSGLTSDTQMSKVLNSYGVTLNADGTINWNNVSLTDRQKASLTNLVDVYRSEYNTGATTIDELNQFTYTDSSGNVASAEGQFNFEFNKLLSNETISQLKSGDAVKLINGYGESTYVTYNGSGFNQITENEYNNSASRYIIERNNGQTGELTEYSQSKDKVISDKYSSLSTITMSSYDKIAKRVPVMDKSIANYLTDYAKNMDGTIKSSSSSKIVSYNGKYYQWSGNRAYGWDEVTITTR